MALADVREPAVQNVQVTSGDSTQLSLLVRDSAKDPIPMTAFDGSIAPILDPATDEVLESWTVDLSDAANGVILLTLTAVQTAALCPCQAVWYFQAIDTSDAPNNSHTLLAGDFVVLKRRGFGG